MNGFTFLTGGPGAAGVLLAAAVGGAALGRREWLRPDPRHRAARVGATLAAVGALALLALGPAVRVDPGGGPAAGAEVALWTGGPRPRGEGEILRRVPPELRFRLPGADAPPGTLTVPDAATLRRHVARGLTLHLLGDGLETGVLAALPPFGPVAFHPGPEPAAGAPARIVAARFPRVRAVGEPFRITGRVQGGSPAFTVRLEGLGPAPAAGPVGADGTFRLQVPGLPAPGRYGWKLGLLGPGERVLEEEPGGVSVTAPDLPRVLVLEGSPHPDIAGLRGWLGAAGGAGASRTEVGRGRYRFGAAGAEFSGVDAALLGHFDLVITDVPALARLPAPERSALRRAVEGGNLGVLVLGGSTNPGSPDEPLPGEDQLFFLPWALEAVAAGEGEPEPGADRPARLRWTGRGGGEVSPEAPVPVRPFRLLAPGQPPVGGTVALVRDAQGRAVAARVGRGGGRVGVTLTADTGQWGRAGQPEAFAAFWSALLGDLSAPSPEGRWVLSGPAASGPAAWVDGPLEPRWQGGADVGPAEDAAVAAEDAGEGEPPVRLPLAADPPEPARGTGRFWPRGAGWHRVSRPSRPGEAGRDFYVAPGEAWPGVRADGRRRGTARFVSLARDGAPRPPDAPPIPLRASGGLAGALFLVFVATAGFLWAEARRSA